MASPAARLASVTSSDRPLLVCYLPVGDPAAQAADATLYAEHGVDVVEAGVPASVAGVDGPDVAGSMARALATTGGHDRAAGVLAGQLDAAGRPAAVWMSYRAAPDQAYLDAVVASGVGGVLLPDADPHELAAVVARRGLIDIPFLAHDPRPEQVEAAGRANGYVLLAAHDGATGPRETVDPSNGATLTRLRTHPVRRPLLLGFGISTPDHVRAALDLGAQGVVVGTACVRAALAGRASLRALLTGLRRAVDG